MPAAIEDEPVVEAIHSSLPELDTLRNDAIASPELRQGNVLILESFLRL